MAFRHGADANVADDSLMTPLYAASYYGHVGAVEALLELAPGLQVDSSSNEGFTPLHIAAQQGNKEVVALLVEKAVANVNAANKAGATPLYWACYFGRQEVIKYLLEKGRVGLS